MYQVAQHVLSEQKPWKTQDSYNYEILNDIRKRKFRVSDELKAEFKRQFGNRWRDYYMGRINIVNNGNSVDSEYTDLARTYPWLFDEQITAESDQIDKIDEVYNTLTETKDILEYHKTSEDARYLAMEIYNKFWNIATEETVADKYTKEAERLKHEHRQAMAEIIFQQQC